jgi:hypothetical protein
MGDLAIARYEILKVTDANSARAPDFETFKHARRNESGDGSRGERQPFGGFIDI